MRQPFPFSAIVGQDEMKEAMILTAIDQGLGGVLVFGDRGSAEWHQMEPEDLNLARIDGTRVRLDRGSPLLRVAADIRYTRFKAGHPSGFLEAFANLYVDIADALVRHRGGAAAADGPAGHVFGIAQAEQGFRLLEAVHASARERRWRKV